VVGIRIGAPPLHACLGVIGNVNWTPNGPQWSRRDLLHEVQEIPDSRPLMRVSDGIRTHDRLDHNQELYQLSYAHHVKRGP
jgi:hypothetical protein